MRLFALLCICVLAAASLTAQAQTPTPRRNTPSAAEEQAKAERDKLRTEMEMCMREAVDLVDDKMSPANVVAEGVMQYCARQNSRIDRLGKTLDAMDVQMNRRSAIVSGWVGDGLVIVLMQRAAKLKETGK